MSERWARTILKVYRGAGSVFYPFMGPFLRWRARGGKEDRSRRAERYGYASWDRPDGPLVWMHAASVGESLAIMPLIKRIESFGINLVLTTGTVTSAEIAEERLSERTIHQYVPLDMRKAVARFLDHWKPDLAIFAESEIWPVTVQELGARKVPQVLVNARMSDRSDKRWRKRRALASAIFENLSQVIAQSELDAERFSDLGARRVTIAGNLKVDTGVPAAEPEEVERLRTEIGGRPTWIAVSTHSGEEVSVVDVHRMVVAKTPDLLTILVPRHPDRSIEIEELLTAKGAKIVTRSSGDPITPETDIYLGDTIGEIGLYLRLAEIAFLGKSLKAEGGQNPLEPAVTGAAILSGRHVQNFRDAYHALLENKAARLVKDEKMLADCVHHLLDNPEDRERMKKAAFETVDGMRGALDRCVATLDPYLTPLRLRAGLDSRPAGKILNEHGAGTIIRTKPRPAVKPLPGAAGE